MNSMSKEALEGMASILRENGYEVLLKEDETKKSGIKKPYINNTFNKIRDIDLYSLGYSTCLFLGESVVEDFKMCDYIAVSDYVTIGYLGEHEADDGVEDLLITTNRISAEGRGILETLSNYAYEIKLSDVLKLMGSKEEFYV